jgi:hypothetical protein
VMLDLYLLPERENKFNQNPFPHYVLLTETDDPELWFMSDPDFRWQGVQSKQQVLQALASEAVAGGFIFDSKQIKPAENQVIADYFLACIQRDSNPMTDRVRQVVQRHAAPSAPGPALTQLGAALHHLPVLAIRKYAYEHAFAFFWLDIGFDEAEFEAWCEVIEDLVSSYKKIQYRAMKLSTGQLSPAQQSALFSEIYQLLDQQDATEFRIKARLYQLFEQWCGIHQLGFAAKAAGRAEVSL